MIMIKKGKEWIKYHRSVETKNREEIVKGGEHRSAR